MPSPTTKARSAKPVAHHHEQTTVKPFSRAPFGFVFFLLLLAATFMFSSFYVVSETAREDKSRQEMAMVAAQLENRVSNIQGQVNQISAELTIQKELMERLTSKTPAGTLPASGTR